MCFIKIYQLAIIIIVLDNIPTSADDAVSLPSCSFINNDTCGYTLDPPWEVVEGKSEFYPSPTHAVQLMLSGEDDDSYALLRSARSNSSANYTMSSPVIPKGEYMVSFAYSFPASVSSLYLETRTVSGISMGVWNNSGLVKEWTHENLRINMTNNFTVLFRSKDESFGFVGLDHIQICDACPPLSSYNGTDNYTCDTAEVFCDNWFISNGKNSSVCRGGQWDHMLGCDIIDCNTAPSIGNGNVTSNSTTFQSVAAYTCDSGYSVHGNNTIECLSNGNWSPVQASCNPVDCRTPYQVANANVSSPGTTYMSVATYTCDPGYNLSGNNTIHCMSTGIWSTVNVSCHLVDCKAPQYILHGRVTSNTSTYQSAATYICDPGYNVIGNDTAQCLHSGGIWSRFQASCYPVVTDCNIPSTIAQGSVTVQTTTFQSVAYYTCDPGYSIMGNRTIQCMSNGEWSHPWVICTHFCVSVDRSSIGGTSYIV